MSHAIFSALRVVFVLLLFAGQAVSADTRYHRTVENYTIPDVILVNQDGQKVHLKTYLQSDKPVAVEFIYGTCTTICPILSASYVNLQQKLGSDVDKIKLVSVTIDPENDTPKVMKAYLKRYRAKPGWDFLTGSRRDINTVMTAFNAYIPDKMSHFPLTLFRAPSDGTWIRIFGLMSSSEFLSEYQKVAIK